MLEIKKENSLISDEGIEYFETDEEFTIVSKFNPKIIKINNSIYTNSGIIWEIITDQAYYIFK